MKLFRKPLGIFSLVALVAAGIFFSCDTFKNKEEDYKIFALVTCNGSNLPDFNSMTVNYYIDKQYPFTDIKISTSTDSETSFTLPKKITTITVTATKVNYDSTINIIIYKNYSIVKYVNLPACSSSTTSCSTTISLTYDVNEEKTKAAAGGSKTSTSSSSTSSSSTSSTSSSTSSTSSTSTSSG
jgi:hypothetical protein